MADDTSAARRLHALGDLVTPMAVRVAATLRLADHIAAGATTAPELAAAAGVPAATVERLLRHLAAVGVVERDGDGRYALTPTGDALRDDHPAGMRAVLDAEGPLGRGDRAFVHLLHSIRTGEAAFPLLHGRSFWDDVAADPERTAAYDALMAADVAAWAPPVIAAHDWSTVGHVVDVGGGNGSLLAALLRAFPTLRGAVFDQPATAEAARATLAAAGVADRADVVAGSFFDPLPAGAGGYLLSAILHDWDDDRALAILRRCAEAAGRAGRVFVVEKTGVEGAGPSTHMDLRMLVYFGGRERTVEELVALAARAGLRDEAVRRADDLAVLVFVPA